MAFSHNKARIIALTENGLEIDIFSQDRKVIPANLYQIKEKILMVGSEEDLKIYELDGLKQLWKKELGRLRQIEIGSVDNGNIIFGCLLHSKKLIIFNFRAGKTEEISVFENVTSFKIEQRAVLVQIVRELIVLNIEKTKDSETIKLAEKMRILSVSAYFIRNNVFLVWAGQLVSIYKNMTKILDFTFAQVDSLDVKISPKGNFVLCCATSIVGGSYFGHKELFLYDLLEKKGRKLNLQSPNFFEFVTGGYSVCYGPQPAKVSVFNFDGTTKRTFPKGAINRIYFGDEEKYVCFAGFDNLNGMIEVYNAQSTKLTSSLKMLGASQVFWSPCGAYFCVAITNALKVENKIVVYDYFGREIARRDFNNLISCEWVGEKEKFEELERPKELNIYKEGGTYVPPSFGSLKPGNKKNK